FGWIYPRMRQFDHSIDYLIPFSRQTGRHYVPHEVAGGALRDYEFQAHLVINLTNGLRCVRDIRNFSIPEQEIVPGSYTHQYEPGQVGSHSEQKEVLRETRKIPGDCHFDCYKKEQRDREGNMNGQ